MCCAQDKVKLQWESILCQFKICLEAGIVAHSCKSSVWEAPLCTAWAIKWDLISKTQLKWNDELKWNNWQVLFQVSYMENWIIYVFPIMLFELNLFLFCFFFLVCLFEPVFLYSSHVLNSLSNQGWISTFSTSHMQITGVHHTQFMWYCVWTHDFM